MKTGPVWNPSLECASPQKLLRQAQSVLPRELARILGKSSFYRSKFRSAGMSARSATFKNWANLPFTEKDELTADQRDHPPFGSNLTVAIQDIRRIHRTSGTTGRPVFLALTRRDVEETVECGARCFWASGLRPKDVVFHCLNYCLWIGGFTDHHSLEKTGAAVVPYGSGNTSGLVESMLRLKPTAIHCTPSYLSPLETVIREEFGTHPRKLGLKIGLFAGEGGLENPKFRKKIEEVWGFRAMNANYGVSDVLSMFGAECRFQTGLHFMGQGNLLPEVIDPKSSEPMPIERGVQGELVLTNLVKEAQPLLRFRTRDLIEILDHGTCRCGRSSFRFKVRGRSDDQIKVKGVNVFPSSIGTALGDFLDRVTGEFQIVLESPPPIEHLRIRIELRKPLSSQPALRLQSEIRDKMKKVLFLDPEPVLMPPGSLSKTEGKAKRIVKTYLSHEGRTIL